MIYLVRRPVSLSRRDVLRTRKLRLLPARSCTVVLSVIEQDTYLVESHAVDRSREIPRAGALHFSGDLDAGTRYAAAGADEKIKSGTE